MRQSIQTGISFGLTSGTITTLGLMIGLYSSTNSKLVVLGGILTIAIADSMSDALGIHISEESDSNNSSQDVWRATLSTWLVKLFYTSLYALPVIFLALKTAIVVSILIGLVVLVLLSYLIAKNQNKKPINIIGEHVMIMVVVIILTYYFGLLISNLV